MLRNFLTRIFQNFKFNKTLLHNRAIKQNRMSFGSFLTCSLVVANTSQNNNASTTNGQESDERILKACQRGEESLTQLMQTIEGIINEISLQYQDCLSKQIAIVQVGTKVGPVGEHWDELTEIRVKANELKREFNKYEVLVKSISQLVYNHAVASLLAGNSNAMELINVELHKLECALDLQVKEIRKLETELLAANRDNILFGTN